MPHSKKYDPCMFCMCYPCECAGKPVKKVQRRATKPEAPTPPPAPVADLKSAMKAAMKSESVIERPELTPVKISDHHDDEEFCEAINNLEPILHPEENVKYSEILNRPDLRAKRWRNRHG